MTERTEWREEGLAQPTDQATWQALKNGDAQALSGLVRKYYRDLHDYGWRMSRDRAVAEDCIQDLFAELWSRREKLGDVRFVKSYLIKSLRRRLIKASPSVRFVDIDGVREPTIGIIFSHEEFLIREQDVSDREARLARALNALAPRQREIIYLRFYENLTYEEISEAMSLGIPTLYDLLSKAIKKLRAFFGAAVPSLLWWVGI